MALSAVLEGMISVVHPVVLCSVQRQRLSVRTFDTTGDEYCERWEDMVDEVDRMFEWMVANRLNHAEWLLLGKYVLCLTHNEPSIIH